MDILLMDVDGVLVRPPEMYGLKLLARHPEAIRAFFHGPFLACSTGRADLRDHAPALMQSIGYEGDVDRFLLDWFEHENHPDLGLIAALHELRAAGWPNSRWHIHLATNQERHRLNYLLDEMKFADFLDGEFASCTVGVRKPEPEYFAQVMQRLPASSRIVFWDDAPENVEAARTAGWEGHVYADLGDFRRTMGLPE